MIATLGEGAPPAADAFVGAQVVTAPEPVLRSWIDSRLGRAARLELGPGRVGGPRVVQLAADGFTRHTFLCGQSGSGKTYTLGLLLEQLLLHTDLKVIVLDPNSDYVRIMEMDVDGLDPAARRRAEALPDTVRVFRSSGPNPLRIRYGRLPLQQQALVLGLEPWSTPSSSTRCGPRSRPCRARSTRCSMCVHMWTYAVSPGGSSPFASTTSVPRTGPCGPARRTRPSWISCLQAGAAPWSISASSPIPVSGRRSSRRSCLLCGDGGDQRQPVLLIIDEAHNVTPAAPADHTQALAIEHAVRIAAEGHKYGIYLFLATQRPDRIHPEVLAQCENLVLMKVNSSAAIDLLAKTFSHVPPQLARARPVVHHGARAGRRPDRAAAADPVREWPAALSGGRSDVPATWASAADLAQRPAAPVPCQQPAPADAGAPRATSAPLPRCWRTSGRWGFPREPAQRQDVEAPGRQIHEESRFDQLGPVPLQAAARQKVRQGPHAMGELGPRQPNPAFGGSVREIDRDDGARLRARPGPGSKVLVRPVVRPAGGRQQGPGTVPHRLASDLPGDGSEQATEERAGLGVDGFVRSPAEEDRRPDPAGPRTAPRATAWPGERRDRHGRALGLGRRKGGGGARLVVVLEEAHQPRAGSPGRRGGARAPAAGVARGPAGRRAACRSRSRSRAAAAPTPGPSRPRR